MVPRADVLLDASNTEVHVYGRGTKERMRAQAVVVLTAVALVACYARTLRGMFEQWSTDEDMSHGFVVPIVVLWIVWRERALKLASMVFKSGIKWTRIASSFGRPRK